MPDFITKWNGNVERTHVRYNNRYSIALCDRIDRIPFDKPESFFMEDLK